MQKNKTWILRRIVENVIIEMVSSCFIYLLVIEQVIPSSRSGYIHGFGASALIFLTMSYFVLYAHFWALHLNKRKYFQINLSIAGVMAVISIISVWVMSDSVFTLFFGYTKSFRVVFNMSALQATLLFWAIYIALIFLVIVKTTFLDKRYKRHLKRRQERELFFESVDYMDEDEIKWENIEIGNWN